MLVWRSKSELCGLNKISWWSKSRRESLSLAQSRFFRNGHRRPVLSNHGDTILTVVAPVLVFVFFAIAFVLACVFEFVVVPVLVSLPAFIFVFGDVLIFVFVQQWWAVVSSHGDPISTAVAPRSPNHRATLAEPHKAPMSLPALFKCICIRKFRMISFVCVFVTCNLST